MSMSATRGRTRLLAGLLLVAVLVAVGVFWWARDSGDPQAQSDSPKTSGGPTVSELAQKYLSGQPATAEAVASAQGTIYARNDASPGDVKDVPATLRILAVEAGPDSTHVRISLSTDSLRFRSSRRTSRSPVPMSAVSSSPPSRPTSA